MSSQTPNINLTLPTGVEKVSRQIINDNNTKIDTAVGTLNNNMARTGTSVTNLAIHKQCGTVFLTYYGFNIGSEGKTLTQEVPSGYRPYGNSVFVGKTYNGSSYVDCLITIKTDGTITITDLFSSTISGLQANYTAPKQFVYELA